MVVHGFSDPLIKVGRHRRMPGMRAVVVLATFTLLSGVVSTGIASAAQVARHRAPAVVSHKSSFLACEVTDTGGINDRSFNASAWAGLQAAKKLDPSMTIRYLSSTSSSDYVPNIATFVGEHCGIIITVGFLMGNATEAGRRPTRPRTSRSSTTATRRRSRTSTPCSTRRTRTPSSEGSSPPR